MKIKRLRLGFIVRELIDQYNALRKKLNNMIPSVCISYRYFRNYMLCMILYMWKLFPSTTSLFTLPEKEAASYRSSWCIRNTTSEPKYSNFWL
jgi:hypothetical protein